MPPLDPVPEFDLYGELGVSPEASLGELEVAWRAAVRAAHPDVARAADVGSATERTARLNIARGWLTDPVERARYDALRLPRSNVTFQPVDPLSHRPATPESSSARWTILGQVPVLVAVLIATITVIVGIGSNVVTIVAFDLSLVTILFYGLYACVGVVYRRLGP